MTRFKSENEAFKAGGDKTSAFCREGKPNCGFRVLRHEDGGFKVLMVPDRGNGAPFYI